MKIKTGLLLLVGLGIAIAIPFGLNAMKPMSDDEIKDLIVKGSIKQFEEGNCPDDSKVRKEEAVQVLRGQSNNAPNTADSTVENPYACECACPYHKDLKGNTCGQNSAYFKYEEPQKPKCYREDVRDYEVNDFRSENTSPDPNKPHPELK